MKKFIKHIFIFIIPLFLGILYLFTIRVEKDFSYHFVKGECDNKASWIYNHIFNNEENIDFVFSGASHTSCAIMDKLIEDELNKTSDQKVTVANIGYCRGGRDIQYVMLKDLFKHKKPKILILEVTEDEPKKSHPVFPYIANTTDLFDSFVFFNQRFLLSVWKCLVVRFEYLKFKIFTDKGYSEIYEFESGYVPSSQVADKQLIVNNEISWQKRLAKQKSSFVRKIELNYSKHYINNIIELGENNQCKILFLYLPESGSNLRKPLLHEYYQKLSETIILPDSILNNDANWKDAAHLNDSGAKLTSEFIVSVLKENQ